MRSEEMESVEVVDTTSDIDNSDLKNLMENIDPDSRPGTLMMTCFNIVSA
jgi:hypothetical protein